MRVAIFIPAYNAEKSLAGVVGKIPKNFVKRDVVVVNDGSKDNTEKMAKSLGVTVLSHGKNMGYGAAQKTAYNYSLKKGYDAVVMVHADGQHDPKQVTEFVNALKNFDAVTGSRFMSGSAWKQGMPLVKVFGNRALSAATRVLTGLKVSETHNGYRAYSRKALGVDFNSNSNKFEFDTEMLLRIKAKKMKIGEIPIRTIYNDSRSYLNNYSYGARILKVVLRYVRGGYRK
jgi:glycosyltransferase involved in cell wall biosynthesis